MRIQKENIYKGIRYLLVIGVIIAIVLMFAKTPESKKSFDDVAAKVESVIKSENAVKSSERFFRKYYGLNAEDFQGVMIYTPVTNMHAEEILLIKLNDSSEAESVKEIIEARRDSQKDIFSGYAPDETALLENSILDVRGNFIIYIVAENAQEIDEMFRKSL